MQEGKRQGGRQGGEEAAQEGRRRAGGREATQEEAAGAERGEEPRPPRPLHWLRPRERGAPRAGAQIKTAPGDTTLSGQNFPSPAPVLFKDFFPSLALFFFGASPLLSAPLPTVPLPRPKSPSCTLPLAACRWEKPAWCTQRGSPPLLPSVPPPLEFCATEGRKKKKTIATDSTYISAVLF